MTHEIERKEEPVLTIGRRGLLEHRRERKPSVLSRIGRASKMKLLRFYRRRFGWLRREGCVRPAPRGYNQARGAAIERIMNRSLLGEARAWRSESDFNVDIKPTGME